MAKTTNLNFRIDIELKNQAEKLYSELGLSMSAALNIFIRQSVRYGGIPFELRLSNPNMETLAAIEDVNSNKNLSEPFDTVEELFEDLNA